MWRAGIETLARTKSYFSLRCLQLDIRRIKRFRQPHPDRHSSLRPVPTRFVRKIFSERGEQTIATLVLCLTATIDVFKQQSLARKFGNRRLRQQTRVQIGLLFDHLEKIDDDARRDYPTNSQTRKPDLGKTVEINHQP